MKAKERGYSLKDIDKVNHVYEVFFETSQQRGKWHYVGSYSSSKIAYHNALLHENKYKNLPFQISRFQIVHKRYEKIIHSELYVRPICRNNETLFDSAYRRISNFFS